MLVIMPNLAHPLFSAPAASVDSEMVHSFLELQLEESFTVDYKRVWDAAPETVAAMANTYGGLVLVGVDANSKEPNMPGKLVSGQVSDKDKLVNKMITTFDPPGWTPDVIPVSVDGKLLLIIRVDQESVPRPLFYRGSVKIRLDGRNATADRRIVQQMFADYENTVPLYTGTLQYSPGSSSFPQGANLPTASPDLVVRAATARALPRGKANLRLRGTLINALTLALSRSGAADQSPAGPWVTHFVHEVDRHQVRQGWEVDPQFGNSRFVRLSAGHKIPDKPSSPCVRIDCAVRLGPAGDKVEVVLDFLFWLSGEKLTTSLWTLACYEAVRVLAGDVLPCLTQELLGTAALPTPPLELHITPGPEGNWLDKLISTDMLGHRSGTAWLHPSSEFLPEESVAAGDLDGAVTEALHNIALDWRFLHPKFPPPAMWPTRSASSA